ncbi:MAG: hypothetical protein ABR962_00440 [Candidatus Bathyarchaeia archaeon]|jgi:nucleoside-diphosphate-sugar epimerase
MYISDCARALSNHARHLTETFKKNKEKVDIFNVGSDDKVTVKEIAETVSKRMRTS